MNGYFKVLRCNPLFESISATSFDTMLSCLGAYEKWVDKREVILLAGDPVEVVGIVLSGAVKIVKTDEDGNETVVAEIREGDSFGEALACAGLCHSPVTAIATRRSQLLLLNYRKLITTCNNACVFHTQLMENLLKLLAHKNLQLSQKIEILAKRTLREKILCFLQFESQGRNCFSITLNREDFANYICADRSALSSELSKMQRDGVLRYDKNTFELL